jgi:hypothetical protein
MFPFFLAIDDVFVRQDLYKGKYAPDMIAWAEFDSLVGASCRRKGGVQELEIIVQEISRDIKLRIKH